MVLTRSSSHDHPLTTAMLQPDFYPHPTKDIRLVQTHISWVFLTGKFAYKVKKPVDFGFVDFTTLDKRRFFCERELQLNRRLAPELYLEVLPVSRVEGTYLLGDRRNIQEYCLKMLQFSQDDLLDRRLEEDRFDPDWMDRLAEDMAAFHATAEAGPDIRRFGNLQFLREHMDANLDIAAQHTGTAIREDQLHTIRTYNGDLLSRMAGRLRKRQEKGHIRACHGDLHLRNMALYQGMPRVFDCIEFNDEFRLIDTMNDIAFLVMDCDARGRPDLGFRFLSCYLEYSGDYDGLMLLPLYLSYRACVRGKVACLLSADADLDQKDRMAQVDEARRYFSLAESYAKSRPPRLFAIGGLSGSGKSRLARLGCGPEQAIMIRSDATRKRLARMHAGLDLYGAAMNKRTYRALFTCAKQALAAGFSVILDATFLRREDRDHVRQLAQTMAVNSRMLWLDVDEKILRRHIRQRIQKGKDVSDADLRVLDMQLAHYRRPDEPGIIFLSSAEHWPADLDDY